MGCEYGIWVLWANLKKLLVVQMITWIQLKDQHVVNAILSPAVRVKSKQKSA